MNSFSYHVSRHELTQIIDAMPAEACRAMHLAVEHTDLPTAQRLLREAAATYFTSARRACGNAACSRMANETPKHDAGSPVAQAAHRR